MLSPMSRIQILPDYLVNQIAAGEVVERPASALKELAENALDAGATQVDITLRLGGKSYISIRDNGQGMDANDLKLALCRHATSKLPDHDLVHIQSMGFRGEALPSIASVSRMSITSRPPHLEHAWQINASGDIINDPVPSSGPFGTHVEIRDLFYLTPARLKFMKTDAAEYSACKDVIYRLALARPDVSFSLTHDDRSISHFSAASGNKDEQMSKRIMDIMGAEFHENSIPLVADDRDIKVTGRIGIPTYNKGIASHQFIFVNDRPVKDRQLLGSLRAAYGDLIPRDRHPICVIFIQVPPEDVDMNVHPAKAEVRFRDSARIRGITISSIRNQLATIQQTSSHLGGQLIPNTPQMYSYSGRRHHIGSASPSFSIGPAAQNISFSLYDSGSLPYQPQPRFDAPSPISEPSEPQVHLGFALAYLHNTYILAQTQNGLVMVDAHAAHERLTYERYKTDIEDLGISSQLLLKPDIITLDDDRAAVLIDHKEDLLKLGFDMDGFGPGCVIIRSIPSDLIGKVDIDDLIKETAEELIQKGAPEMMQDKILHHLATRACHHSVRAGQPLSIPEMNALLRQIESNPNTAQCNHGRPTFIHINMNEIEKLFERK
jgi:DNA mismatch repair protein MutL